MTAPRLPDVAAAILAGGRGRRLGGRQKALIEIDGEAILDRQLRVLAPLCASTCVVAPDPSPLARPGLALVRDRVGGGGPLDGLAAALAWSPSPWLLALACDQPNVSGAVIELLAAHRGGSDVVAPRIAGRAQPLLALYRRELAGVVLARLRAGRARAVELLEDPPPGTGVTWIDEPTLRSVNQTLDSFDNVNRPEDLL